MYTKEDYLTDLQLLRFGAQGVEAMEAQARVRLYEAGRYSQLETLIEKQNEAGRNSSEREPSILGKAIGALMFLAGLIILLTSCAQNGVDMSAGSLFGGLALSVVGYLVFLG